VFLIQALVTDRPIALPPVTESASMTTDKECMEYARECARLAGLADQQIRDQLLNMAREWMSAAMHEGDPTVPDPVKPAA
jgi:hypothetical protein